MKRKPQREDLLLTAILILIVVAQAVSTQL